ncbi:hypothetical protein KC726_03255 [Candidatus Woesebacteria bacterium]|nr:hypothetical protein [Candidatus Woesebacteria bacterium]
MANKKHTDLYEKIRKFQEQLIVHRPSQKDMIGEIQMMHFRVRPISGEVSQLNFKNPEFIDALWSLGKLDEFFREELPRVRKSEHGLFMQFVNNLRYDLQLKLNTARLVKQPFPSSDDDNPMLFEMEIVKQITKKVH